MSSDTGPDPGPAEDATPTPQTPEIGKTGSESDPEDESGPEEEAVVVELDPPRMDTGGRVRQMWRTRQYLKKREKLLGDGHVQWFLIEDTFPRPRFVKPKRHGAGLPELEHEGERYLFPTEAMLPSSDGIWTVVHRKGEADPINIKEPSDFAIPSDRLEEYLNLRVQTTPPGWLDALDLDAGTIITIGVAAVIGFGLLSNMGIL